MRDVAVRARPVSGYATCYPNMYLRTAVLGLLLVVHFAHAHRTNNGESAGLALLNVALLSLTVEVHGCIVVDTACRYVC